jgi:hypothetical protein
MTRLLFLLTMIACLQLHAQKPNETYVWKSSGIENDTLVSEIRFLNDTDYVENDYVADKTTNPGDYKTWPLKIRNGKLTREGKYFKLSEYDGQRFVRFNMVKFKSHRIQFYSWNFKKNKLVPSKLMVYKIPRSDGAIRSKL